MKITAIVAVLTLVAFAGTALAGLLYWGHPYAGVINHQSELNDREDNAQAFGGCPYLQQQHEGVEPYGDELSPDLFPEHDFAPPENPPFSRAPAVKNSIIFI